MAAGTRASPIGSDARGPALSAAQRAGANRLAERLERLDLNAGRKYVPASRRAAHFFFARSQAFCARFAAIGLGAQLLGETFKIFGLMEMASFRHRIIPSCWSSLNTRNIGHDTQQVEATAQGQFAVTAIPRSLLLKLLKNIVNATNNRNDRISVVADKDRPIHAIAQLLTVSPFRSQS